MDGHFGCPDSHLLRGVQNAPLPRGCAAGLPSVFIRSGLLPKFKCTARCMGLDVTAGVAVTLRLHVVRAGAAGAARGC
jgi:hypothetical protein